MFAILAGQHTSNVEMGENKPIRWANFFAALHYPSLTLFLAIFDHITADKWQTSSHPLSTWIMDGPFQALRVHV